MASYSRPLEVPSWTSIETRSLQPISIPPGPLTYPLLPSPPREPAIEVPYVLTTHIIPAAYPRTSPDVQALKEPPESASKEERKRMLQKLTDDVVRWHEKLVSGQLGPGSKKILWNCINRYVRQDLGDGRARGVTLLFAHANGFPKEIWEPVLNHLLSSSAGTIVDEVWSWEAVQHGDSALINAENLGGIFDWSDNARDILNFLLNYMPSAATPAVLPTNLQRLPPLESESRKIRGFTERTFVTVGHSFGGCTSALAALHCPALFSSLVLVDPVIVQPGDYYGQAYQDKFISRALQRRQRWPSSENALQLFKQNPFFAAWDPACLRIYVECGLTPDPKGGVRLKMSGIQEALVYVESRTPLETYVMIDKLDERIELRWIVPGSQDGGIAGSAATQIRVWRRPNNASNIMIPSAGHLITQEAPRELANDLQEFIQRKYGVKPKL